MGLGGIYSLVMKLGIFWNLTWLVLLSLFVQSSCTKPELDADEAEIGCLQDLSYKKCSKPLSGYLDMEKHEEYHSMDEKVEQYHNQDEGKVLL